MNRGEILDDIREVEGSGEGRVVRRAWQRENAHRFLSSIRNAGAARGGPARGVTPVG